MFWVESLIRQCECLLGDSYYWLIVTAVVTSTKKESTPP